MIWDIFCRVIDNFGDIGVCWRLSTDLAGRGERVRLWVDDSSALDWMAPGATAGTWYGIEVLPWQLSTRPTELNTLAPADVWVEAFGCSISEEFIAFFANQAMTAPIAAKPPTWINLEYLSAEDYVERAHGLPSPVMHGAAKGWTKHFIYPGFSERTGGLLREEGLTQRQVLFIRQHSAQSWLTARGIEDTESLGKPSRLVSLFCYEPEGLPDLLDALAHDPHHTNCLLVTPGRAAAAVRALVGLEQRRGQLHISYLPELTQTEFDELLWICDLNFVRGEDSLARALWAGRPFVWHIYPQDDGAHVPKLHAFLDRIQASPFHRDLHNRWNGISTAQPGQQDSWARALANLTPWQQAASALKAELAELPDLTGSLLQFVNKNR